MNGLEAIRAMENGEIVQNFHKGDTRYLYKIDNGNLMIKRDVVHDYCWEKCLEFLFDENYEIHNSNQNTGWYKEHNQKNDDNYFVFGYNGRIVFTNHPLEKSEADEDRFSHILKAQEIEFKQRLFRKLQRFSDENGGNEIDWSNSKSCKCCICYDHEEEGLVVGDVRFIRDFGQVYFKTEELAEQAIELFKEDLIKYFTHKWMECE